MIQRIEHLGKLIDDTAIPGEQRRDLVAPAHGNGAQLAANRFMTLVATRSFRGCDDDRSIIWQLRRDGYDGPIIKDHGPLVDMAKLLPHAGGSTQTLIHRVRTCAMAVKEADYPYRIRRLTEGDFTGTAIYHARVHYTEEYPGVWAFG